MDRTFPWNKNNEAAVVKNEENLYLEKMFELVNKGILELILDLKNTNDEFNSFSGLKKSKIKKIFEMKVQLKINALEDELFNIMNLLKEIDKSLRSKNFEKLDDLLRTYHANCLPVADKLVLLSEFYSFLPEVYIRHLKDEERIAEKSMLFSKRKSSSEVLYENLKGIYNILSL
ncbi:MAG: hypothetical protein HGA49_02430 [Eubacteriaceae bacterium]|nr:hypothetical protein [Eubacteriaceae bacterium]